MSGVRHFLGKGREGKDRKEKDRKEVCIRKNPFPSINFFRTLWQWMNGNQMNRWKTPLPLINTNVGMFRIRNDLTIGQGDGKWTD
jgi:hypothetical protein